MSETKESLLNKIARVGDLEKVVRTMKVLAASNINQYEQAVQALSVYFRTVELGMAVNLSKVTLNGFRLAPKNMEGAKSLDAVVFGSDQGLVGQFNENLAGFVVRQMAALPGKKNIWAVGERMNTRLKEEGLNVVGYYNVPGSVNAITPLISQILLDRKVAPFYIFHNRPLSGALYESKMDRLLPLDDKWRRETLSHQWPSRTIPEILGNYETTLLSFIEEYLFVSLFKACTESLASENANRLAAMQRAEKNINEMLDELNHTFHQVNQNSIDEELFDIIAGFEALENSFNKKTTGKA